MAPGTREALIDAAEALIDAGGVDAVTLREVGRRAGVSHNAPYKHFTNKEALLTAVAVRELHRWRTVLGAAFEGRQDPEVALRELMQQTARTAAAYPARFKLIYGRWTTVSDELADAAHAAYAQLLATVRAAQERGAMPAGDPERLAALLRAVAHGAADLAASGHLSPEGKGRSDAEGLIDDLLAYLLAARGAQMRTVSVKPPSPKPPAAARRPKSSA